jgi:hypothetical protein
MTVPPDAEEVRWFNASPAARVTASSAGAGTAGPAAAVDRRTRGPAAQVAWNATQPDGAWLRLEWDQPLVIRKLGLYAVRAGTSSGGPSIVRRCEVVLFRAGSEVGRRTVDEALSPAGTFVGFDPTLADAVEVRVLTMLARGGAGPVPLLAEVETIARLP